MVVLKLMLVVVIDNIKKNYLQIKSLAVLVDMIDI